MVYFSISFLPAAHSLITVGNGACIPRGSSIRAVDIPQSVLNNVLVAPSIISNLLSVRQFTRYNSCSIKFDAFGFSVKELKMGHVIVCFNSVGNLYTIPLVVPATAQALLFALHLCGISPWSSQSSSTSFT
jgi:hypothetical protein